MTKSRSDWEQHFQSLSLEGRAFIDGQYCAAASGATFECLSPVDGRFLANVACTDQADADRAVAVARQAFNSGVWSGKAPAERKRILTRFAELILEHQEELALLETLDMGKPIGDSMAIDIPATANAIRWNAEAIDKLYDEVAATPHDQLGLVTREPAGVVAAIVPWNFPLIMASWKFAPALAAGNSFILKPSEKSPLTAIRIAQLALVDCLFAGVAQRSYDQAITALESTYAVVRSRHLLTRIDPRRGVGTGVRLDGCDRRRLVRSGIGRRASGQGSAPDPAARGTRTAGARPSAP